MSIKNNKNLYTDLIINNDLTLSSNYNSMPENLGFSGAIPPGVSVKLNISEALLYKNHHTPAETLAWFYNKVKGNPKGVSANSWDYKQYDKIAIQNGTKSKYEDFGNFHYGVIAKALGFSDIVIRAGAGFAQGESATGNALDASWRMISDFFNGGNFSFGDDGNDQKQIIYGINSIKPYIDYHDAELDIQALNKLFNKIFPYNNTSQQYIPEWPLPIQGVDWGKLFGSNTSSFDSVTSPGHSDKYLTDPKYLLADAGNEQAMRVLAAIRAEWQEEQDISVIVDQNSAVITDEYMANLQQDLPGGDGVYAEAGAEWLGSIMAQAGTESGRDAQLDAAYTSWQAAEQARLERESSLAAIESVHALTAAIESRDGVSMVRELVNSINAVDIAAMHRGHGSLFGEHGDLAHAGLSAVGNGLGLAQALQAGDGWSTVSGTAALVRDIDSFVQANGGSFLGDRGSAALGALGRVLNFGAALEGGDGYAIAASGLNLASDIGNYIDSGGTTLTLGPDAGAGLTALSGVASGASLMLDIRNLSDAFESGDARDIAISGGHTAVSAVNTYNAASQLAGGTGTTLGADLMPIVGYGASVLQLLDGDTAGAGMGATMTTGGVALSNAAAASTASAGASMTTPTASKVGAAVTAAVAVVELAEGEYAGAAVDAVCSYLLYTGNIYCIAAAVVIQVVRALFFGHKSVPSASGSFVIDADGHAQLEGVYGGDEDLRDDAKEFGEALLPVIQSYVDSGGRAEIYGSLPTFVVKQGEPVKFEYLSADGVGKVSVLVEDSSRSGLELLGVLYARDRGASVEEALRVSTDASGDVDVARLDAILAGQGFVKRGLTYTYGETKSRECGSWGTGVFQGGEQQGPVGETFVAKDEQVISLPLREEDLPGRQLGGILSARSLGGAFVDYGSGLFLLSLGGLLGGVAPAAGAQAGGPAGAGSGNASGPVVQPLDGYELSVYERLLSSGLSFAQSGQEAGGAAAVAGDFAGLAGLGGAELEAFLDRHWSELVRQGNVFSDLPRGSSYYHRGTVGAGVLHADGSRVATEPPAEAWWDEDWEQGPSSARGETLLDTVLGMTLGESSGGRQVRFGVWQALHESAPEPLPPEVEQGAFFITPQDSSLRFVESQLVHGVGEGFGLAAESLRFVGLGEAEHGRVYRDVNGDIRFEAEAGFTGQASFLYQVADALGNILTRRALVDVYDVNDAPLLADDTVRLGMDTPFALSGLLANDRDPEGDALHLDHFRGIEHGRVEERNGELFFVPDAGFTGAVEFSYFAYDRPGSYPGMARVRLSYVNADGAPSLQDDQFLLLEDTELTFSADRLLANDQGQGLELLSVQGAAHGSVRLDADGTISFIPDADYFGRDAGFSYTARSGTGVENSAWAGVAVLNVQDAPVVSASGIAPVIGSFFFTPAVVAGFVHDADGDSLRLSDVSHVVGGHVEQRGGIYTFVADAGFTGTASFDYEADDGHMGRVSGHLDFAVNAAASGAAASTVAPSGAGGAGADLSGAASAQGMANRAPEQVAAAITLPWETDLRFDAATLGRFMRDADGDRLKLSALELQSGPGRVFSENGGFVFRPEEGFTGPVALSYTATDGKSATSGRLRIEVEEADRATVFGEDRYTTREEEALMVDPAALVANDADKDGELFFVSAHGARYGSLSEDGSGWLVFTPDADYFGEQAGFRYTVRDAAGYEASSWVGIGVENVNDAPVLRYDRMTLFEDQAWELDSRALSGFVYDADGDALSLVEVGQVQGGSLSLKDGVYTFTPESDYYGRAGFDYVASDGQGMSLSGHMTMDILPVNDLPTVALSTADVAEDGIASFSIAGLLAGAQDVEDGRSLRFGGIDSTLSGSAWIRGDTLFFQPDDNFNGQAFVRYRVLDTEGAPGYGHVQVRVSGAPDAPVAVADSGIPAWSNNRYDNVYSASVLLANDHDADGDTISLVSLGPAEHGSVSVDSLGAIHYRAAADNWVGFDSFSYRITDGRGGFAEATATLEVRPNSAPDVYAEVLGTREDTVSILPQGLLLKNDSDTDGDHLFISSVGRAEHCQVRLLEDGSVLFVPELNYNDSYPGQASFAYTVSDGISAGTEGRAYFDIEPVNDAPIVRSELLYGAVEDNHFRFTVDQLMANDTDVELASAHETDSIHFAGGLSAAHGQLVWDRASETILYTPNRDFSGLETFTYQVADAQGGVSTGTSHISVSPVNDAPLTQSDYGAPAEEVVWNNYRISGLLGNDYDADGDALSIVNPHVSQGNAQVRLSGGNLSVRPAEGMAGKRIVVDYTVTDGHGGQTPSQLIVNQVLDHNYAPTFSGMYAITNREIHGGGGDEDGWMTFSFHAEDKNGGNSWGDWGDIMAIHGALGASYHYGKSELFVYSGGHFKFGFDRTPGSRANLHITAVDHQGATGTITVNLTKLSGTVGIHRYSPVVFDLEGDGLEVLALDAGVRFDWNRDGVDERTGWIGGRDAFLVYDYNADRMIDRADELMLSEYMAGATSDLEGLRSFDTNKDHVFDSRDESWSSFGLWQDGNSDGVTDTGEFRTLEEAGIAAIDLQGEEAYSEEEGGSVLGTVSYTRTDGSTGTAADMALYGEEFELTPVDAEETAAGDPTAGTDTSGDVATAADAPPAAGDTAQAEVFAGDAGHAQETLADSTQTTGAAAPAATDHGNQEDLASADQTDAGADADQTDSASTAADSAGDDSTQETLASADQGGGEPRTENPAVPACCSEARLNTLAAQLASDLAMAPEDGTAPDEAAPALAADSSAFTSPVNTTNDIHRQLDDFQDDTTPFA